MKQTVFRAMILMGMATLMAFIINMLSPRGIALMGQWETDKGTISAKPKDDVVDMKLELGDIERVKEIYDQGRAVFVDARSEDDYVDGHIKGAETFPLYEFDQLLPGFKNRFPLEKYIITYCSGRTCNDSHILAQKLMEHGFMNISVFIDGFPAWKENGYPVE